MLPTMDQQPTRPRKTQMSLSLDPICSQNFVYSSKLTCDAALQLLTLQSWLVRPGCSRAGLVAGGQLGGAGLAQADVRWSSRRRLEERAPAFAEAAQG